MSRKNFHQTFLPILKIFGPAIWALSILVLYQIYMGAVHGVSGWTEGNLKKWVWSYWLLLGTALIVVHILFQTQSGKRPLNFGKVFALALVYCSLIFLFFRKPNAEGYDMFLDFIAAFISGLVPKYRENLNTTWGFSGALSAWLTILSINEIFEGFYHYRFAQVGDIPYNMAGAGLGLLLSLRWFWQERLRSVRR